MIEAGEVVASRGDKEPELELPEDLGDKSW